jgi:anhydro-N-acetylmuramic acid kinase
MKVIGLMSGTSLDGIDAVLVEFSGTSEADVEWRVHAFLTVPYRLEQRRQIHEAILHGTPADLCRLDADLGEWFAAAALAACAAAGLSSDGVDLIGSHGQTIWHIPRAGGVRAATMQLGDPATIAERTGIPVVSDFRSRDVAAGGEGAPLVPWQDRVLFSLPGRRRVLQNIGGIANLTWIPPKGDPTPPVAFDTGPGNMVIDAAVELATGGRETLDRDGCWAARGRIDEALLAEILAHPFFQQPPPKSTGRETFGRTCVEQLVRGRPRADEQAWADLVATATAATAQSIAAAIDRWVIPRGVDEVVISGGGARNPTLVGMIREAIPSVAVMTGEALGIDPDAKEAIAFAGLAWAFACGIPGNIPEATGARGPRILGSYTPGCGLRREAVAVRPASMLV